MTETRRSHRRAGPLFGVVLLVVTGVLAFTPAVSPVGAIDPTPSPTAELPTPPLDPTPDPTPAPTPDPTADPTPAPTPDPTADPTPPTPTADPSGSPDPSVEPSASPEPSAGPTEPPTPSASPEPSASPTPAPGGLRVAHTWVDVAARDTEAIVPGALDAARGGAERYRVYVVRFQVVNDGNETIDLSPRVAVASAGSAFRVVPAVDPVDGVAFYAATDDGKAFRARTSRIAPSALRLEAADGRAVPGLSVWGVADPPTVRLAAGTFTEVEFAVRATVDAGWERSYDFRLLDAGAAVAGPRASITLRARPAIRLTPGQRDGVDVDPPVRYALQLARPAELPDLTRYALLGPQAGFTSPHGDASLVSDTCAACHSSHVAQNRMLNQEPPPQANQCFTCHDGSGAEANVAAEFEDPAVPANNPATSAWYSHPATTGSSHLSDREDEFAGVLDRHAECADCHQPHVADASLATETPVGWSASGALKGASGVRVVNGAAGTAPTYTWAPTTELEYQLCFKCHSGFTQLPARDPAHPSRWALDKAVELNPANLSYHPVQAAGTNQTTQMAASLAGTSPYKLWAFTTSSTIRCLNCHGDSRQATPAAPPDAAARLAPHAVKNQGLLIANYRNGDPAAGPPATSGLKGSAEAYSAADFALCYTCHGEAPFVDWTGDPRGDTRFGFHGLHTYAIAGEGTGGTDIDIDGDGQGLAICAECHYRIHGTTDAVDGQAATARLVNFAPNAKPRNGRIEWIGGATPSCTVSCHGKNHTNYSY